MMISKSLYFEAPPFFCKLYVWDVPEGSMGMLQPHTILSKLYKDSRKLINHLDKLVDVSMGTSLINIFNVSVPYPSTQALDHFK